MRAVARRQVIPVCPPATLHPSAYWHRCRRSPRPGRTCGQRDRVGWGQSCCPHPPSECGTVRIASRRCQIRIENGRADLRGGSGATVWQGRVYRTLKRLAPFLASPVMMRQRCVQRTKQSKHRCRRALNSRSPSAKWPPSHSDL
jgi:hypothetical protein